MLNDLTLPEEYLIARSHPVGVVLKLRPGGQSSPLNYHALRGHIIVIPQHPGPLLHFFYVLVYSSRTSYYEAPFGDPVRHQLWNRSGVKTAQSMAIYTATEILAAIAQDE